MKIQFRTESGSLYEINGDENGGTWKRLEHASKSSSVRTAEGVYSNCSPISIGLRVILIGPPLVPYVDTWCIITTEVTQIILGEGFMNLTTHKVEVVRIKEVKPHPNADRLEIVEVYGYSIVVGKGEFKEGSLGAYIPPDSIVPATERFKFVWEMKGYAPAPDAHDHADGIEVIPEKYRRIKAKVLRGVPSEGLLIPIQESDDVKEGDDIADILGITHYEPPESSSLAGDCEVAPWQSKKRRYPKTIKGWLRFIWHKIFPKSNVSETEETDFTIPIYDIDSWQRNKHILQPDEPIWITEKIHGANCRFVFMPGLTSDEGDVIREGRMYVGSHRQWKKDIPGSAYWEGMRQNPWIEKFCRAYPGFVLYGELVPTQKLAYGQKPGKYRVFGFDILDTTQRSLDYPNGKWLSHQDIYELSFSYPYLEGGLVTNRYLLDHIHWVPTIGIIPYDENNLREFSNGESLVDHANHMREGIVIHPLVERNCPRFGRVILKLVSVDYLASKKSDE